MVTEAEKKVFELAADQYGLITSRQCLVLGLSEKVLLKRIASPTWTRLHRGVFKIGTVPPSFNERELAALMASGAGAVLSHQSAARRLGLDTPRSERFQITIPAKRMISPVDDVDVWRSRDLVEIDVTVRGPFRVTKVARTILDLASVLADSWLRAAVDSALRLRPSNLTWICQTLKRLGHDHSGSARLRTLLGGYDDNAEVADSVLESLAMELGLATGRKPTLHYPIVDGAVLVEVDLAWPELRLCVELDSWKHHSSRVAFERDRARDRALVELGWVVLRYTWHDVTQDKHRVVRELMRAHARSLEKRAPTGDLLSPEFATAR
jgi:hypothetical protein